MATEASDTLRTVARVATKASGGTNHTFTAPTASVHENSSGRRFYVSAHGRGEVNLPALQLEQHGRWRAPQEERDGPEERDGSAATVCTTVRHHGSRLLPYEEGISAGGGRPVRRHDAQDDEPADAGGVHDAQVGGDARGAGNDVLAGDGVAHEHGVERAHADEHDAAAHEHTLDSGDDDGDNDCHNANTLDVVMRMMETTSERRCYGNAPHDVEPVMDYVGEGHSRRTALLR